jgi:Fe-S cluster biogenesis protein NfuA
VTQKDLTSVGERLEHLLEELRMLEPTARQRAEECIRLVTDLYGAGLNNVMELIVDSGDVVLLDKVVKNGLVHNLLVLHGLHPFELSSRIDAALDSVRPYLASHGGDVEVLEVDEEAGAITIRLLGSCDGCPSSAVTLKMAVEDAIRQAAPEVAHIIVDGYVDAVPHGTGVEPEPPATPIELSQKPVRV